MAENANTFSSEDIPVSWEERERRWDIAGRFARNRTMSYDFFPNSLSGPAQDRTTTVYERVHWSTLPTGTQNPPYIPRVFHGPPKIESVEKPNDEIRYGKWSFVPTADLDQAPKAYPAKPDIPGFSPCHEKAMAACSVLKSIQNSNFDEDDLTSNADIFSHFWRETNVVQWEDEGGDHRPGQPDALNSELREQLFLRPMERSTRIGEWTDSTSEALYAAWDRETSIYNDPLNYDLNEPAQVPETRRVQSQSVGGDRPLMVETGTSMEPLPELESRGTTTIVGPSNAQNPPAETSFSAPAFLPEDGLIDWTTPGHRFDMRQEFVLDAPLRYRSLHDFIRSQQEQGNGIPDEEVPRSFLSESLEFAAGLDSDTSTDTDDEEGQSVFHHVPNLVDMTPSMLWKEFETMTQDLGDGTNHVNLYYLSTDTIEDSFQPPGDQGLQDLCPSDHGEMDRDRRLPENEFKSEEGQVSPDPICNCYLQYGRESSTEDISEDSTCWTE